MFCSATVNISDGEVVARSRHLRFAQEGEAFLDAIVTRHGTQHLRIEKTITSLASFIFPSHQNFQDDPFNRKSHGTCFWDRKGFLLVDFMSKGTTINVEAHGNTQKKKKKKNSEEPFRTAEGEC
jgi:hypothetical protein